MYGDFKPGSMLRRHFHNHLHPFALRMSSPQELFCIACDDYQFCSLIDNIVGKKRTWPEPALRREKSDSICTTESVASSSSCPRSPIPVGLVNMGSTCFMNSVLQVLCAHLPFTQHSALADHAHRCSVMQNKQLGTESATSQNASVCIPCELRVMAEHLWSPHDKSSFVPSDLLFALWSQVNYMAGYAQQDAHEFLIAFFSCLENQLQDKDPPVGGAAKKADDISNLYSGRVQSCLRCSGCGYCSLKEEHFVDLNLSIDDTALKDSRKDMNIYDCLTFFTISEDLSTKMTCEKCVQEQQFSKQLTILRPPDLLVLHLKRFDFLKQRKITRKVNFPLEGLDLGRFRTSALESTDEEASEGDDLYDLQGLVCHSGSLHQGHYIAYVRKDTSAVESSWIKCDDEKITVVRADEVAKAEG
eukprot:gene34697-42015_t